MTRLLLFSLCLFAANAVSADQYLVTDSGLWAATCPATVCTAIGDSWSFSFEVDSNPIPLSSTSGVQFISTIADFTYSRDGVPVPTITAGQAIWFNSLLEGGLLIVIPTGDISILAPQLYTGAESSPTIQLGAYSVDSLVIDSFVPPPYNNPLLIELVPATTVPEPSTYGLTLVGLVLLLIMLMGRFTRTVLRISGVCSSAD
jgi:hypothetical protein